MWCCIITAAAGAVMGRMPMRHNLEDADTLLEFIETNTTYGFDRERLFVAGHSVGGFVTAQLLAAHPELKAAVLLAPCRFRRRDGLCG